MPLHPSLRVVLKISMLHPKNGFKAYLRRVMIISKTMINTMTGHNGTKSITKVLSINQCLKEEFNLNLTSPHQIQKIRMMMVMSQTCLNRSMPSSKEEVSYFEVIDL
jgi:hypothetical protein